MSKIKDDNFPDKLCPNCKGYGFHQSLHKRCPCHICDGRGFMTQKQFDEYNKIFGRKSIKQEKSK